MSFLGGLVGLAISIALYLITATILGVTVIISGPIARVVAFFANLLTLGPWIAVAVFTVIIVYTFAYVLATVGLLPLIAAAIAPTAPTTLPPPPPPVPLPVSLLENFMRGLMIGMTAGLNLGTWSLIPGSVRPLARFSGLICFLAVFPFISRNIVYQGFLGWLSWLMPMSYLATAVGFLLFVINLPSAIAAAVAAGAPGPMRFDVLTATIETTGGAIIGITGFVGGFNLGNFMFITPGPPPGGRTAFNGVNPLPGGGTGLIGGLSSHETGHTLNAAAFGGVFHWINAIDENVVPFLRNSLAYGELTAESHFQRGGTGLGVGPAAPAVPLQHVGIW